VKVAPSVPGGALFAGAAERAYLHTRVPDRRRRRPVAAASRTLLIRLAPKDRIAQYFGLFALTGKVTSFIGPLLIGAITARPQAMKAGMAVLVVFFRRGAGAAGEGEGLERTRHCERSEAIHSFFAGAMDCFAALAMTATESLISNFEHPRKLCVHILAARCARGLAKCCPLGKQRAQGRPGARCTRGLVCKLHKEIRTRAYRFSEASRPSLRDGFTV